VKREKERKKLHLAVNRHLPIILQGLFTLIADKERRIEICRTSATASEALRMIATAIEDLDFEEISKTPGEFFGLIMDIASKVLRREVYKKVSLETPSAVLCWFAEWLESEMGGVRFE
jgi:hypothetical protein